VPVRAWPDSRPCLEGARDRNTCQAVHSYSSPPSPSTSRIHQSIPFLSWACALDQHMVSALQSRVDWTPTHNNKRTNERTTNTWDIISKKLPKVKSTGHNSSSGLLTMPVSVVVPDKLPGQKRCEEEKAFFWHFQDLIKITLTWPSATFWCLCVHSVEDSTLILISDSFHFSLLLKGS